MMPQLLSEGDEGVVFCSYIVWPFWSVISTFYREREMRETNAAFKAAGKERGNY